MQLFETRLSAARVSTQAPRNDECYTHDGPSAGITKSCEALRESQVVPAALVKAIDIECPNPSTGQGSTDKPLEVMWYTQLAAAQRGPFTTAEVVRMHASGEITHETKLKQGDQLLWYSLDSVREWLTQERLVEQIHTRAEVPCPPIVNEPISAKFEHVASTKSKVHRRSTQCSLRPEPKLRSVSADAGVQRNRKDKRIKLLFIAGSALVLWLFYTLRFETQFDPQENVSQGSVQSSQHAQPSARHVFQGTVTSSRCAQPSARRTTTYGSSILSRAWNTHANRASGPQEEKLREELGKPQKRQAGMLENLDRYPTDEQKRLLATSKAYGRDLGEIQQMMETDWDETMANHAVEAMATWDSKHIGKEFLRFMSMLGSVEKHRRWNPTNREIDLKVAKKAENKFWKEMKIAEYERSLQQPYWDFQQRYEWKQARDAERRMLDESVASIEAEFDYFTPQKDRH